MRALFLDFDGVLHPASAAQKLAPCDLVHARMTQPLFWHVNRLAALLACHHDVRVVLHTSWRNVLSDAELATLVPELMPWLAGVVDPPYRGRDECIREWVRRHAPANFRVLDDEPRLFSGAWPELITCDPELGLSDEHAAAAVRAWLEATSR